MKTSINFQSAANDYLFLLDQGYPQKSILKLVGDRYKLSGGERSMLYRGISKKLENNGRKGKIHNGSIAENKLFIDAFNQLITIASYLNGSMVFISTDGFLRDASEIHGKLFRKNLLKRSVELVIEFIKYSSPGSVEFVVDEQISKHQMIFDSIIDFNNSSEIKCSVELTDKADRYLIQRPVGLIATSDSQIIDKSELPVFDLAWNTLHYFYKPKIFKIKPLLRPEN
ncbi:MAG: DUF434 domain-containing protein [Bacteroidales bacterium]|nr:DUF434 domain-containing protein [Bacteroidales bacterium]